MKARALIENKVVSVRKLPEPHVSITKFANFLNREWPGLKPAKVIPGQEYTMVYRVPYVHSATTWSPWTTLYARNGKIVGVSGDGADHLIHAYTEWIRDTTDLVDELGKLINVE